MSGLQRAGALGAILFVVCGAQVRDRERSQEMSAETGAEVEREVRAFLAHYLETLEAGDEDAVRSLFVADDRFAWYTDGAKSYASPDDVLAGMRQYAGIEFETTLSNVRVVPLDATRASARSGFRTNLTIPGADDYAYGGVITWLTEKDSTSGAWRVLLGHTSTPGGPPSGDKEGDPYEKR